MTTQEERLLKAIFRPWHNKTGMRFWRYAEARPGTGRAVIAAWIGNRLDDIAKAWVMRPGVPTKKTKI